MIRGSGWDGRVYDVWWACLCHMEGGNILRHSQMSFATVAQIPHGTVKYAWRALVAAGLLVPEYNELGQLLWHRVAPAYAYRGRPWRAEAATQRAQAIQALQAWREVIEG